MFWLALVLASCSRTHGSQLGDSSTHWLRQCAADAECGGLSCECGVCSKGCGASNECGAFGASATCVAGAAASCGGSAPTRICDAMCERDADCPGSAASCVAGSIRCRRAEVRRWSVASPRALTMVLRRPCAAASSRSGRLPANVRSVSTSSTRSRGRPAACSVPRATSRRARAVRVASSLVRAANPPGRWSARSNDHVHDHYHRGDGGMEGRLAAGPGEANRTA